MNFWKNNNKINYFLIFLIIIYPLLMAFQGIEMLDAYLLITEYDNFFINPEISQPRFASWLSVFLGAVFSIIFGEMGLWGFKLSYLIVLYLILYAVYSILKPYSDKTQLLFFVFLAMIFVNIDRLYIINYNILTVLFYLYAGLFLHSGLIKNSKLFIFIAGFILGLNIFIRFPNILGIGLLLAIIYYDLAIGNSKNKTLIKALNLILGYIFAIVVMLCTMYLLGHYELYIEKMKELLIDATDSTYHHSSSLLLKVIIKAHIAAFIKGFIYLFALGILLWLSKFWNQTKTQVYISSIFFALIAFILLFKINQYNMSYAISLDAGLLGLSFIVLLWMIFKLPQTNPEFATLVAIAFLIMEMSPLGSDTGLRIYSYGLFLVLPLILVYLFSITEIKVFNIEIKKQYMHFLRTLIISFVLIYSLILSNVIAPSYGDSRNKLSMVYTVDHPKLRGIFTTQERAEALNTIIQNLQKHTDKYHYILSYELIPIVDYLTGLKPYLDSSLLKYFTPSKLKEKFEQGILEKELPLVVRAKRFTLKNEWPRKTVPLGRNTRRVLIEEFLNDNYYKTVYEDKNFEILTPQKIVKRNPA